MRKWKRNEKKYVEFYRKQGVENMTGIKGAFVSSGYYVKKPVKNNVLLVGDAAGLVDAMSGEGIFCYGIRETGSAVNYRVYRKK